MTPVESTTAAVARLGFTVVPKVLTASEIENLIATLGKLDAAGRRGLLNRPAVKELACSARLLDLARPHLSAKPRPVQALYLDKSAELNWSVNWHQDLTVPVKTHSTVPGFSVWSVKDGVPHVQPPVEFLEQMITIRLHLDDCDQTNGALRVLPGSHRHGRLSAERIRQLREECPEFLCRVPAGGALVMRPLLLHGSSRSKSDRHRRVLHIDYAGFELPQPLAWHEPE